jgi:hypothetical protein
MLICDAEWVLISTLGEAILSIQAKCEDAVKMAVLYVKSI